MILMALVACIGWGIPASAQPFGNEWINYSQQYFKIPIAQRGMYRLSRATLDIAGVPTASIQRNQYQLWYRGKEMAILVNGANPSLPMETSDFIDFYAERADGQLDTALYLNPAFQAHRLYNLHNDTASYYLTWTQTGQGKRMASYNENRTNVPVNNWHWADQLQLQTSFYAIGKGYLDQLGSQIQQSWFDRGEGWTSPELTSQSAAAGTATYTFSNLVQTSNARQAVVELVLVGRNGNQHVVDILAGPNTGSLTTVRQVIFDNFDISRQSITLPAGALSGSQYVVQVRALAPVNGSTAFNRISVAYARLRFAQNLDFSNTPQDRYLEAPAGIADYQRLSFINISPGQRVFDVHDLHNVRLLQNIGSGAGVASYAVDGATQGRRIVVNYTPVQIVPQQIRRVQFRNINPNAHNYIILTHALLRQSVPGVGDPVLALAAYRASVAGGRYDTLIITQQQVNDQFGYGEASPQATRRFAAYMKQGRAQYLFLIGKARLVRDRGAADYQATNLVYSFGVPGSDVLLTAGLSGRGMAPDIATGRLAATTPLQVSTYLNKLREHEAQGYNELWRKNTLVLTGGRLGEADGFKFYGQNYQRNLTSRFMGSRSTLLSREDATTIIESINIADRVNNGLSLIALYGHSSPAGSDIDIGNATEPAFNNQGKYPTVILNGCAAGNFYTTGTFVLADNWLFTPNRGCIAFIGNTDLGLASSLDAYMTDFIRVQFQDSVYFSRPIGQVMQEVVRRYATRQFLDAIDTCLLDQFNVQGDPALLLFGAPKCDYKTSNPEIFLTGRQPTTADPSIRFGVVVSNLGRTSDDSISFRYRRTLADGRELVYTTRRFAPIYYQDTLFFDLPKPEGNSGGINRLEFTINFTNTVDELRFDNNTARLEFVLPESGLTTLFPEQYGIVNQPTGVRLVAQSNNMFATTRRFLFECDTTIRFNSPIKQNLQTSATNLPSVSLSLPVRRDSIVYYWRVRFEDVQSPQDTTWYRSSFTFISGSANEGWSQGDFPQFFETENIGIVSQRQFFSWWDFTTTSIRLKVDAAGGGVITTDGRWTGSRVFLNGVDIFTSVDGSLSCFPQFGFSGTREARLVTLGLDRNTLGFKVLPFDPNRDFETLCGRQPFPFNWYNYTTGITFERFYNRIHTGPVGNPGTLNTGDFVLFLNSGNWAWGDMASLPRVSGPSPRERLLRGLSGIGIDTTTFLARSVNGHPCIVLGRRGATPGTARVLYANPNSTVPPLNQILTLDTTLSTRAAEGSIRSPRIGPALRWNNLSFNIRYPQGGTAKIQVIGTTLAGVETVLVTDLEASNYDLSGIDATQYPYLYLKATLNNPTGLPPQLRRWTVQYEGVPEGTVNTQLSGQAQLVIPEKQEGQPVNLKVVFQNISSKPFVDTIGVRVRLRNGNGREQMIRVPALRALAPNDTGSVIISNLSTVGWGGSNSLQVFFNPQYQPELLYTNNSLDVPFTVKADRVNPVLDVTFDGVRILDGDIVSPTPAISVVLRDDNKFLLKSDTTGLNLTLSKVGSNEPARRISFASGEARLSPATANSPLRVDYQPQPLENGTYNLRVQGEDASGNRSGASEYAINFQVVNESSVTHFYPYPNPFSTSTRFVFTLTGSEVPQDIKIQIMTLSGRIVREITRNELGPIRIGNNITSYAWDGTDEFGDKLGNGVYLYRVFMQQDGNRPDHRTTAADDTFRNGIGKLYLMR